jgi:phage gpG-like protein
MGIKRTGGGSAKAKRLTADMRKQLGAAVYVVAGDVQADAQISLSTGSVSGKNHTPSAPGTPPNSDTGALANSIEVERVTDIHARVVVHSPYGAIQELGGTINHPGGTPYFMKDGKPVFVSKSGAGAFHGLPVTKPHRITLPERPYMRPAAQKNREPGKQKMRLAVETVLKGGKIS